MLHLEHSLYGAEIWILRKIDQKYLKSSETVVLGKDGDQLDCTCEKCIGIT